MLLKIKNFDVLIDEVDLSLINSHTWQVSKLARGYYVVTVIDGKTKYLHRLITGAQKGREVDHINCNPLDNRRENLRVCSSSQNKCNIPLRADNTSGYKGVSFDKSRNKFRAMVWLNGQFKNLGRFETAKEASIAYETAARELHGEFYYGLSEHIH